MNLQSAAPTCILKRPTGNNCDWPDRRSPLPLVVAVPPRMVSSCVTWWLLLAIMRAAAMLAKNERITER